MAYQHNYKFWLATTEEINDLLLQKRVIQKLKPTQDKFAAHGIFAVLYSRYVTLVNRLSYIFDKTCQVQKRALIQRFLEAAANRLLELRNELKQIELSEFIYLDNALIKQKILIDDIAILHPCYFPMSREQTVQDLIDKKVVESEKSKDISESSVMVDRPRRKTSRMNEFNKLEELAQKDSNKYKLILAINLIRIHEKARQARVFKTNIRYQPEKYRPKGPRPSVGLDFYFTHKPNQPMLFPVKRPYFNSNYFRGPKFSESFECYVRPAHRNLRLPDMRDTKKDETVEGPVEVEAKVETLGEETSNLDGGLMESPYESVNRNLMDISNAILQPGKGAPVSAQELRAALMKSTSFAQISKLAQAILRQSSGVNPSLPVSVARHSIVGNSRLEMPSRRQSLFESKEASKETGAHKAYPSLVSHISGNGLKVPRGSKNASQIHILVNPDGYASRLTRTSVRAERKTKMRPLDVVPEVREGIDPIRGKAGNVMNINPDDMASKKLLVSLSDGMMRSSDTKHVDRHSSQMSLLNVPLTEDSDVKTLTDSMLVLLNTKLKDSAATRIQTAWRQYALSKRVAAFRLRKLIFYGMIPDWVGNTKKNTEVDEDREKLRNKKALFDQQFIQVCKDEKARILKVRGPWIMEDISDHIRAWFREFYDGVGEFDRYPEEFEGGTILVLRGETMTVEEFRQAKLERATKKKRSPEEKKKEAELRKNERERKIEEKRKEKAAAKLLKRLEAKAGKTYDFSKESPFLTEIEETMKNYESEWTLVDDKNNVNEKPYMDWISLGKFAEIHQELRLVVDEVMRVEFELLRKALALDRRRKYKPQKKKKQKKKKGKKGKKRKAERPDITADRTTESLYFEMEDADLFMNYERSNLNDYVGEYNYSAYEKRMIYQLDPQPGQGEIRDVIREAIYGMGPLNLPKAKSICITGPPKCGKLFLIHAIASELGAVIIDISPEKVLKFEEDMNYFIHLINKMARVLQPTIIFINNCERIFWKKVPKDQAYLKPKLLGKYLIKQIVKPIRKEEKVIVIGITDEPYKANIGKMKKAFEKTILVPRCDYGTAFQFSQKIALSKPNIPRDFEFSPVSMVTQGYTSSNLYDNLNETLDIQRRMKLPFKPLKAQELISGYLDREEPIFPMPDKEFEKYTKFNAKVNKLAKQRAKLMKEQQKLKAKEIPKGKI